MLREAAQRLHPVGAWPTLTLLMALAVMALLGVYAVRSLSDVIRNGLKEPGAPATVGHLDRRDDDRQGNPGFRERRQNGKIQNVLDEASSPSPPAPEASRHRRRTALL